MKTMNVNYYSKIMNYFKTFIRKFHSLSKANGYSLPELIIASSLTSVVIGMSMYGLQGMLQTSQKSSMRSAVSSRIYRTLKVISDEVYSAIRVESDVSKAVVDDAPSFTLPDGATPVLALQMPDVFERVVYYVGQPADSRLGPQVLYRWGPSYDESGQYKEEEIEDPEQWESVPISDLVTSETPIDPNCLSSDWKANPPSNANGFYSCVSTKNPGLVELHMTSRITRHVGSPVSKTIKTSAFARGTQIQGGGIDIPKFDLLGKTLRIQDPANVKFEVLGGAITCGAGGANIPVTTNLYLNGNSEPESWDTNQPLTMPNISQGTTIDVESIAKIKSNSCNYSKTVDTKDVDSPQLSVLRDGDPVPDITPFDNQATIDDFLENYIEDGKIKLANNQVIYLFELGTTNTDSSAFDLQDNVVLATIEPAQ
jgi:hypothetical protein